MGMVAETNTSAVPEPQKGEYRKIQELASGGMGSVDLSRVVAGPHTGRIVALKRLHPHLEREKHFAEMFFDEARITAGLHHGNVVEILDWGRDNQGHYLALEYVAGDSLLGLIREAKRSGVPIPAGLALFIIGKTAEGLHAAHELRNEHGELQHLVHRDVTPSNILIGIDGSVKLIDFGVAKAKDKLSHTSTGTIKGKFGYMSPEQARGFPIDRRSDVFSLGIVLWETLALKRLYRSESELEILRMIVEDAPPAIRNIRPDVPESVEALLNAALAKSRDDRLGSCGEFADFIWAAYEEQGFRETEGDLIEFFRAVMPERFHAVQQLLAGGSEFIEPTVSRPVSGSFSGLLDANNMVSGAVPRPAPVPLVSSAPVGAATRSTSGMAFADSGSVMPVVGQPASPRRLTGIAIALATIGVLSIVASIVAISMHGARTNVAASATPQPLPPSVVPAAPVTPPTTVDSTQTAAQAGAPGTPGALPVAHTTGLSAAIGPRSGDGVAHPVLPSGHHHDAHGGGATHPTITHEQTVNAMLNTSASGTGTASSHGNTSGGNGNGNGNSETSAHPSSAAAGASATAAAGSHGGDTGPAHTAATPPAGSGGSLTFGNLFHQH